MRWFAQPNSIDQAIATGDLDLALQQWREDQAQHLPPIPHRRLMVALVSRAEARMSRDNLVGAWSDLTQAVDVAPAERQDELSRQTNRLVELTIERARGELIAGNPQRTGQLLELLDQRRVLDWRADQLRETIGSLEQADTQAALGQFDSAIESLEAAYRRQPELDQLPGRIDACRRSREQVDQLSRKLQAAALQSQWTEVEQLSKKLLEIAPRHEIAQAARTHAHRQRQRLTESGKRQTHAGDGPPAMAPALSDSHSFFLAEPRVAVTPRLPDGDVSPRWRDDQFLLWVDGVGGYLVCLDSALVIGQARPAAEVAIGLQGDLRKRHARVEFLAGQHLVHPLGPVSLDGQPQPNPFVLKNGQQLELGEDVHLRYSQPHPLSKTARLDFASRHRTQPWSDGIILATQTVLLGPNPRNHIVCRHWQGEVIFFRRGDTWYCRSQLPFQVDKGPEQTEAPIHFQSQIVGEQFSMTLEPIPAVRS